MTPDRGILSLLTRSGTPSLAAAREAALRRESRIAALPSGEIHLIDEGRASRFPTVVILPAQWLSARSFDAVAGALSVLTRVVRVDLPGHGLAGPFADGNYSARSYARILGELLDDLALDRFVLVGQSHSGIPATALAAGGRDGLAGLVLATTSGMPRGGAPSPGSSQPDADRPRLPLAFYREKLATLLQRDHPPEWRDAIAAEMKLFNELPGRARETNLRARQFDPGMLSDLLPRVEMPTLVLWSSHSTYLPPEMADGICGLLGSCAGSAILPQTGHLLLADAPAEASAALLAYMGRWT